MKKLLLLLLFVSCSSSDDETIDPVDPTEPTATIQIVKERLQGDWFNTKRTDSIGVNFLHYDNPKIMTIFGDSIYMESFNGKGVYSLLKRNDSLFINRRITIANGVVTMPEINFVLLGDELIMKENINRIEYYYADGD